MDVDYMDFRAATDLLMLNGITAEVIGEVLDRPPQSVRQMRLMPDNPSYRPPPPPEEWRPKLAELARIRGGNLQKIAKRIEGRAPRKQQGSD